MIHIYSRLHYPQKDNDDLRQNADDYRGLNKKKITLSDVLQSVNIKMELCSYLSCGQSLPATTMDTLFSCVYLNSFSSLSILMSCTYYRCGSLSTHVTTVFLPFVQHHRHHYHQPARRPILNDKKKRTHDII